MEELAAANSLIRPGTGGLDDYVKGKKNTNTIRELDPRLQYWVKDTYGTIVFQEQIMGLISELMGISFGQADIYRRALEKMHKPANKKKVEYFNDNVVKIATSRGFKEEEAEYIRKLIIDNSGYAFNKSHAVCYSYISYYTAWMKVNYPLIFHKTMLNSNLDNLSEFIDLAKEDGVELLLPHVSYSSLATKIESEKYKSLRVGFNTINGVGEKAVDSIVEHQPYASVNEFLEKNNSRGTNKKVVESLIESGAFDGMGIEINYDFITKDSLESMGLKIENDLLYLNRKQMVEWYQLYLDAGAPKTIPQYEIPISKIKNKYLQQYDLVTEKDKPNVVVIPSTFLPQMELTINDGIKTRKRAKGKLKEMMDSGKIQSDPFTTPFVQYAQEIANIQISTLDLYLEEVNKNGFSFLPHPLQKYSKMITNFKEAADGQLCTEAGIITGLVKRTTAKGKAYYWLMLRTPGEFVRITVWDTQYKKYKNVIKQYGLIAVRGVKGYGGMSLDDLKVIHA